MNITLHKNSSIFCGKAGRLFTPGELAAGIAERLLEWRALGCGPGALAALVSENSADFFTDLFALWELGACVCPLSPAATAPELDWQLADSGAAFLARDGSRTRLAGGAPPPAGTALLLYTSGSTGRPRGVMLSREAVAAKAAVIAGVIGAPALERVLCVLPVSFGHGLIGISLPPLLYGGRLVLPAPPARDWPARLGELCDEHAVTFFSSVPSVWAGALAFAKPPAGRSLRKVYCASADLTVELYREIRAWLGERVQLTNVYGITEAASWVSGLEAGVDYEESGQVGAGWSCEINLDPVSGEVLLKAPYLMSGYHNDPEGTAAALVAGQLRTGDLGALDEQGRLSLRGRLKEQINRGGLKVSPLEVEERLRAHPSVAECCVFALPHPVAGDSVAAAVVLKPGAKPADDELRRHCREALSEYKIPEAFHYLDELPRTIRGKVSRKELRERFGAGGCGP